MKSSIRREQPIHERIERLEKQNKKLKCYMTLLIVSVLTLTLIGAKGVPQDGEFHQITARAITILNSAGQEIMLIGSTEEGTGIRMLNRSGKRVLGIGITGDEDGSGLLVADAEGRPRIGLGIEGGLPSMAIVNEKGKKLMGLGGNDSGYGFVIMDENEVERAGLGYKNGNTGLALYDETGKYVRGIIRQKNGTHYASYVDETGKEILTK